MLSGKLHSIGLSMLISLLWMAIGQSVQAAPGIRSYRVVKLVSNIDIANNVDPDLVNGWGIAFNPDGFVWVNDNGTGKATLYDGKGNKQPLVVKIPGPSGGVPSRPTGIVFFGGSSDFIVKDHPQDPTDLGAPSRFIFATEDGTIAGWAPTEGTQPPPSKIAIQVVDNSASGAIYKGLALSADGTRYLLYATDFHNGRIDVFDGKFQPVTLDNGAFEDPRIPKGFAPFGIQAINGVIYVTYAKQDAKREDEVAGPGLGFVDAYNSSGRLLRRVAQRGKLNAPWGIAQAPANFGRFSNRLIVGNFGDGTVVAYALSKQPNNGGQQLRNAQGKLLIIDGLWGIAFGNGLENQPTNDLFFAAGPNDEVNGLYGKIEAVVTPIP